MTHALVASSEPATAVIPMSFEQVVAMGEQLVRTGFLPEHIRTGAQAAAIILTGRELGMPPMRSLRSLAMVKGKVTEFADSQLARFKKDGGHAVFQQLDELGAVLLLRHPNGDQHIERFMLADAKAAGLLGSAMYGKFLKAMLRSRAITAGLKSLGWEGGVGNYDPDEALTFTAAERVADSDGVSLSPADRADDARHNPAPAPPPVEAPVAKPPLVEMTLDEAKAMRYPWPQPPKYVGKTLSVLSVRALNSLAEWIDKKTAAGSGASWQEMRAAVELLLADAAAHPKEPPQEPPQEPQPAPQPAPQQAPEVPAPAPGAPGGAPATPVDRSPGVRGPLVVLAELHARVVALLANPALSEAARTSFKAWYGESTTEVELRELVGALEGTVSAAPTKAPARPPAKAPAREEHDDYDPRDGDTVDD